MADNNDLSIFLSPIRLHSYQNLNEHFENLLMIGKIAPKLALIEIALRNLMDMLLKQNDEKWLLESKDELVCKAKEDIIKRAKPNTPLSHDQFLSRFTLGVNIAIIKKYKLQDKIFNFESLNFKDFYEGNINHYTSQSGAKTKFKRKHKVNIVLGLLPNIRNRAFHWENLLKLVPKGQKSVPRLSINMQGAIIGIHPQKIEFFLECVLNNLDKDKKLLTKLTEIEKSGGTHSSPLNFRQIIQYFCK